MKTGMGEIKLGEGLMLLVLGRVKAGGEEQDRGTSVGATSWMQPPCKPLPLPWPACFAQAASPPKPQPPLMSPHRPLEPHPFPCVHIPAMLSPNTNPPTQSRTHPVTHPPTNPPHPPTHDACAPSHYPLPLITHHRTLLPPSPPYLTTSLRPLLPHQPAPTPGSP